MDRILDLARFETTIEASDVVSGNSATSNHCGSSESYMC